MKYEFAGRFKLSVHSVDSDGNPVPGSHRETGWFNNLITNGGLDLLGTGGFLNNCYIGTNNTAPSFTDTSLLSQSASASRQGSPTNTTDSTSWVGTVSTYIFAQGAAVGNMQEIGIGPSGTNLFSRALIVDGNGDPTVLVLTAVDILTVTYELRKYASQDDDTDTVTGGTASYTVVTRTSRGLQTGAVESWNAGGPFTTNGSPGVRVTAGALGSWMSQPTNGAGSSVGGTRTQAVYTPGNHYRDMTTLLTSTQGNVSGGLITAASIIESGSTACACALQASFSPGIPKDNTRSLSLTWRVSWGRHTP